MWMREIRCTIHSLIWSCSVQNSCHLTTAWVVQEDMFSDDFEDL